MNGRNKLYVYFSRRPLPCSEPTDARPGSPEKMEVLRLRVERGEELYHVDDFLIYRHCKYDGSQQRDYDQGVQLEDRESDD